MKLILLFILLMGILLLIGESFLQRLFHPSNRKHKGFFEALFSKFERRLGGGESSRLWKELQYLSGSESTARRLVRYAKLSHPGKSEHWYLEKAIYDLKRDRF